MAEHRYRETAVAVDGVLLSLVANKEDERPTSVASRLGVSLISSARVIREPLNDLKATIEVLVGIDGATVQEIAVD